MSWYSGALAYRVSVSIDNTAGTVAAHDWTVDLSTLGDHYWDNSLSNGFDTVLTDADGVTKLSFERHTDWDHANKAGTLRVDGHSLPAVATCHAWLYYGDSTAAVDPASTVTITSAKSAYIHEADPRLAVPTILARAELAGRTAPTPKLSKATTESRAVWWDLGPILQKRRSTHNGKLLLEELTYAGIEVYDGAADQASMYDATETRILDGRYVVTLIKGGADSTDYTPRLTVGTTLHSQIRDFRALLQVRDVDED